MIGPVIEILVLLLLVAAVVVLIIALAVGAMLGVVALRILGKIDRILRWRIWPKSRKK